MNRANYSKVHTGWKLITVTGGGISAAREWRSVRETGGYPDFLKTSGRAGVCAKVIEESPTGCGTRILSCLHTWASRDS